VTENGVLLATTRPSIGVVIVVSAAVPERHLLKS
jgi:hypothetical protein